MGEMARGLCQIVVSALKSKRDLALESASLLYVIVFVPIWQRAVEPAVMRARRVASLRPGPRLR